MERDKSLLSKFQKEILEFTQAAEALADSLQEDIAGSEEISADTILRLSEFTAARAAFANSLEAALGVN